MAVGPRDGEASRLDPTRQLFNMAGSAAGGQLAAKMNEYFGTPDATPESACGMKPAGKLKRIHRS